MFLKKIKLKGFTFLETVFGVILIGFVMSISIGAFITFQSAQRDLNYLVYGYDSLRSIMDLFFRSLKTANVFSSSLRSMTTTTALAFIRGDGKCVKITYENNNLYFNSASTADINDCQGIDKGNKLNPDFLTITNFYIEKEDGCSGSINTPPFLKIYLKAKIEKPRHPKEIEILTGVLPKTILCNTK